METLSGNPTVRCPICGSDSHAPYDRENGYDLVKCAGCGLLYVRNPPLPEEIDKAHQQGEHRGEQAFDITGAYSKQAEAQHRRRLAQIFADAPPSGTWLDIGCGHGEFMAALGLLFGDRLEIVGSEPNLRKQAGAKARGLDVSFVDLESHARQYDHLSLMNVFSHLPSPGDFFRTLNRLLKPGGTILVQTGDTAGLAAKDHYKPYYLPDHLMFADAQIMRDFLEGLGFRVTAVHRYPFYERTPRILAREAVKLFYPGKASILPRLAELRKWDATNMYLLAEKPAR